MESAENPDNKGYKVEFSSSAQKELDHLPAPYYQKTKKAIAELGSNPRPYNYKKLKGFNNLFRIRVGDYRVIYAIEDETITVFVIKIGHRKDIYK